MTGSTSKLKADIFKQEAKFFAGAAKISQLPKNYLPEVAFIGKSNVGKSSLINSVCKRKSLARISNTPGRTRQINFFSIADKLALVDLPGYGYAKVSKSEQAEWEKLIVHYLQNSENLKLVNILIDARRGLKDDDLYVINLMKEYGRKIQIVATKIDKREAMKDLPDQIAEKLGEEYNIILTSSKNAEGIRQLNHSIIQCF